MVAAVVACTAVVVVAASMEAVAAVISPVEAVAPAHPRRVRSVAALAALLPMPPAAARPTAGPAAWAEDQGCRRPAPATAQMRGRDPWVGIPARQDLRAADPRRLLPDLTDSGIPSQVAREDRARDAALQIPLLPGPTEPRQVQEVRQILVRRV